MDSHINFKLDENFHREGKTSRIRSSRPEVEIWWTFSMPNAKINRKRLQIAEISFPLGRDRGQGIKFRCQNFQRKLINSRFCAYAVKIKNCRKCCQFAKLRNPSHGWRDFAHALIAMYVVNTRPYTILGDNSIYLNRTAIRCSVDRLNDFKCVENLSLRIRHLIRRMRSDYERLLVRTF